MEIPSIDDRVLYALAALSVAGFLVTLTLQPQPEWRSTPLSNHTSSFVTMEVDDRGQPHAAWVDLDNKTVVYATDPGLPVVERFVGPFTGRSWETEVMDARRGSFLDLRTRDGTPHMAYQYPQAGNAELVYAVRDGGWNRSRVDWIGINGVQVGRYPALTFRDGRPAIVYLAVSGDRLMLAERYGNIWNRTELTTNAGIFTDAEACGGSIHVATGDRGEGDLLFGTYDGSWSETRTEVPLSGSVGLAVRDCEPYTAYMDRETETVEVRQGDGEPVEVGSGAFSRVSLAHRDGFVLSYGWSGEGLVHGSSPDGETWETQILDGGMDAGSYNDVALGPEGNVHSLYTNETEVVHAEYTGGSARTAANVLWGVRAFLAALVVVLLSLTGRTREFFGKLAGKKP